MDRPRAEEPIDVSVILPVLNEERDIGRLLGQLLEQAPPPGGFEILVADGGSTDATRAIVTGLCAKHPTLKLLDSPGRRAAAGRNVGVRAARGRFVLLVDGHCAVPRQDYLIRTVELFESTGTDCLARPQPLDHLARGAWPMAIAAARHSWLGHNYPSDIYGGPPGFTNPRSAGAAYRRACLEQLGGFDERFDTCEDVEFNHRLAKAGFRSYRHPDLAVHYRPRSSLRELYRQMFRYGTGRARLFRTHSRTVPWPLVLLTAFLLLVAATFVAFGRAVGMLTLLVPIAAWLVLVVAESLRASTTETKAWRVMIALFVIYIGLTLGFWLGMAASSWSLRRVGTGCP